MNRSHTSALAENVRTRRDAKSMSQYALADAAGVSRGTVASVEGGHLPSLRIMTALAKALGTTPQALLTPPKKPAAAA